MLPKQFNELTNKIIIKLYNMLSNNDKTNNIKMWIKSYIWYGLLTIMDKK
jgi:hypothetical protein